VLNAYKKSDDSDALFYDLHIWIGKESSQDEYGTAAYKMVEADDALGGAAVQHRQVQDHEGSVRLHI
jgi:gelsolin